MSTANLSFADRPKSLIRAALWATVAPPFRVRTWLRGLWLLLSFPIGLTVFVALAISISLGISLLVVVVGVPILLCVLMLSRLLGTIDRQLVRTLLGKPIQPPAPVTTDTGGILRQTLGLVRAPSTWLALAWAAFRFPLGLLNFIVLAVGYALSGAMIAIAFASDADLVSNGTRIAALVGGTALGILMFHLIDGLAWVQGQLAGVLLGKSQRHQILEVHARAEHAEATVDLARELHDSVGHAMTASMLQAAAGKQMLDTDPALTRKALQSIEDQSRQALDELDRVLGLLRRRNPNEASPSLRSIASLETLVEQTQQAGTPVQLRVGEGLDTVSALVSSETYRIVQEALTNVMRHASGAPTTVSISIEAPGFDGSRQVLVEVANGPGGKSQLTRREGVGGRGLSGVAARARALGGSASWGTTFEGGFTLHAMLIDRQGRIAP